MSKYTTEVRFICENASGLDESVGYGSVNEIISKARTKIFDFSYPIFDEEYRAVLETKILKHFYTREICEETVGLWKLRLDTRMNEIMPYFNKLYESELLAFDPLVNVDIDKGYNENIKDRTKSNSNASGRGETDTVSRNLYNDTPQGSLQNLENESYLTNARKVMDNGVNKTSSASTGLMDYGRVRGTEERLKGFQGKSGSELLNEFRKTFLNIDVMVIERLEDLFIQLW